MISHRYHCIFIEVPKTASTSIRTILGKTPHPHLDIWQIKYEMEHNWTHYYGLHNRIAAGFYAFLPEPKRVEIGRKQFERYFKFGFVRNPWDRLVSMYLRREGQQIQGDTTFEEFILATHYSSSTSIHPTPHVNQLDWFIDPSGKVIVDFIGKFENLAADWTTIANRLNVPQTLPHKRRNDNPDRKHYTEYYTARTRDVVAERFRTDIDYFGYTFGD